MENRLVSNKEKLMIISTLNAIMPAVDAVAVIGAVSRYATWGNGNAKTQQVLEEEVKGAFSLSDDEWKLVWKVIDGITQGNEIAPKISTSREAEPPNVPPAVLSSLMESYGSRDTRDFGGNYGELAKTFGQVFRTIVPEVEYATSSENLVSMKRLSGRLGKENAERFLYAVSRFDTALKEAILFGTGHSVEPRDGSTVAECYNKAMKSKAVAKAKKEFKKERKL